MAGATERRHEAGPQEVSGAGIGSLSALLTIKDSREKEVKEIDSAQDERGATRKRKKRHCKVSVG